MLRIAVNGALGHMGSQVLQLAQDDPELEVVVAIDAGVSEAQSSVMGVPLVWSVNQVDDRVDVLIDFSYPAALSGLLSYATQQHAALVLGTTGYNPADRRSIEDAANLTAIFMSPNMSYGVAVLTSLTRQAAKALGAAFDVEISETHHRRKVDAPSGTALMLAQAVASTSAEPMPYVLDRPANHGARATNEIGVTARRGGTVAGEHTVGFFGDDEVIELSHSALSRRIMATGALRAAKYIATKQQGLFDMERLLAEQSLVTHIGVERDVAVLTLSSISAEPDSITSIFGALGHINVDMISATTPSGGRLDLAFSVPQADLAAAVSALTGFAPRVTQHLSKLTVEGEGMALTPGVSVRVFGCLATCGVTPCQVTTSETKITMAVEAGHVARLVTAIRDEFGLIRAPAFRR